MRRRTGSDQSALPTSYTWGNTRSFQIAQGLNERCFEWLARIARADTASPLEILSRNRDLWMKFDLRACKRAARNPIVLFDCNFGHYDWWMRVANRDAQPFRIKGGREYWDAENATPVLRDILIEARTIAVADPRAANLIFGAPSIGVTLLASLALSDIDRIAAQNIFEFRPRFSDKPVFWRNFLSAAVGVSDEEMEEGYFFSLQLLGSELLNSTFARKYTSARTTLRSGRRPLREPAQAM
jgi:hypothetical protein